MSQLIPDALAFLKANWNTIMPGTADATAMIGINPNTLKTRLARHQALAMREDDGVPRGPLRFTGYHLVYNIIADRLLRYGFSVDATGEESDDPNKQGWTAHVYAQWAYDEILSGGHVEAILRCKKENDGAPQILTFEDGDVLPVTGDAAVIIPMGTMMVRLATSLFARFGGEAFHESVKA